MVVDDFYLTLIDSSSKNALAVALYNKIFLYNSKSKEIKKLDAILF